MKRDIRRALQFIHKRAVNSGGKDLHKQGICFNLQMRIVKKICPSTVENMYELRMDEDVEGITWPFFGCELKAVK